MYTQKLNEFESSMRFLVHEIFHGRGTYDKTYRKERELEAETLYQEAIKYICKRDADAIIDKLTA